MPYRGRIVETIVITSILACFLGCNNLPSLRELPSNENSTQRFTEKDSKDQDSELVDSKLGEQWKVVKLQSGLKNAGLISFVNERTGWISNGAEISSTSDGGRSWRAVPLKLPIKTGITSLNLVDPNFGLIVAEKLVDGYSGSSSENHFWIIVTNDGGKTWEEKYDLSSVRIYSAAANSLGSIVVYGCKYLNPERLAGSEYFLLKSVDFGRSWIDISAAVNDLKKAEDARRQTQYTNDTPVAIDISSPERIRLITHSRMLFESNDGGMTWAKVGQYLRDDDQVGIKNFGQKDDDSDWMFESTYSEEGIRARLKTVDKSAFITRTRIDGFYLSNSCYLGANTFIASGQTGDFRRNHDRAVILITDDDGASWTQLYRDEKATQVLSMFQLNKSSLWAITNDGMVLKIERIV